jgi:hypothetical protein
MKAIEWAWVALGVFFVLQAVTATYLLRSIVKLRRSAHRIANHVQILSGQLETRGLVRFDTEPEGKHAASKR